MLVHDNNRIEWRESTKGKEERKETTKGVQGLWEGKVGRATKFTWRPTATPSIWARVQGPSPASGHAPSLGSLASSGIASVPGPHFSGLHMEPPQPATHVPPTLRQLSLPPSTATFKVTSPGHLPEPPGLASCPHLHFHLAFSFPALPPLTVLNQGITSPTAPLNISWIYAPWGLYLSNLLLHYSQILKQTLAHYNTSLFVKWIILYEAF